jgi:hypothetical protein
MDPRLGPLDRAQMGELWESAAKEQVKPQEIIEVPDQEPEPVFSPDAPIAPLGDPLDPEEIAQAGGTRKNRLGGRTKTRKAGKGGEIVTTFFNLRDQVKLYHWQTKSFAEHKATDDLIGKLDTNIDMFVEAYMGRYGRPGVKRTLPVKNLTVTGIRAFIGKGTTWLSTKLPRMLKKTDTDLLNIRDEILADLNQIKYLFTLA